MLCSSLAGRFKVAFVHICIAGFILQTVGFFLLSTTPTTIAFWNGQMGYTVLAGLGAGMSVAAVYIMVPLIVDGEDQSIGLGTGLQLRMLGGALGVAIATSILNAHLKSRLGDVLDGSQLDMVLDSAQSVGLLPGEVQVQVRRVFGEAYNLQMKAIGGFSAAQVLPVLLMWKRKQVRLLKDGK